MPRRGGGQGTYFHTNVQVRLKVSGQYGMFLRIRNLTDTQPFVRDGGLPGNGYTYDPFGRRFYAGLRLSL